MYNFHEILDGRPTEVNLVDDGWTHHMARVWNPRMRAGHVDRGVHPPGRGRGLRDHGGAPGADRRDVTDPEVAEILKPYYRYLCKRPCFHDEYLPAFNLPNVTLVDCPAGIERVTERA